VDQALEEHVRYTKTYEHALDLGIQPREILAYATGAMDEGSRRQFVGTLARSPWAMSRVVAIVKAQRTGPVELDLPNDEVKACEALDKL
jgi:hypothetical protein